MQKLAYCEVLESYWYEEGIHALKARTRGTVQEFWGGRRASQAWGVRACVG